MKTLLVLLLLVCSPLEAGVVWFDIASQSRYVRFDDADNTAVNLAAGSAIKTVRYEATDAAIVTAGLDAGTYSGVVCVGTAGAQAATDRQLWAFGDFRWNGTAEVDALGDSKAASEAANGKLPVDTTTKLNNLDASVSSRNAIAPTSAEDMAAAVVAREEIATMAETIEENLDAKVSEVEGGSGTPMARASRPAAAAFQLAMPDRKLGTYACAKPARFKPGTIDHVAVSIDVAPVYGVLRVLTVGTPVVEEGSDIECEAVGPRDEPGNPPKNMAMVEVNGPIAAGEEVTVTVPFTMESGESDEAVFIVRGLAAE